MPSWIKFEFVVIRVEITPGDTVSTTVTDWLKRALMYANLKAADILSPLILIENYFSRSVLSPSNAAITHHRDVA